MLSGCYFFIANNDTLCLGRHKRIPTKIAYATSPQGVRGQPRYFNINWFARGSGFSPSLRSFGFYCD
jgi:hypothetical protein